MRRFLCGLVLLGCATITLAATKEWSNGAGDYKWSTGGNWSPAGAPGIADDAVFGMVSAVCTVDTGTIYVKGLQFTNNSFFIDQPTYLHIQGDGITQSVPGTVTVLSRHYLYSDADQTWFMTNGATFTVTNSVGSPGNPYLSNRVRKTGQGTVQLLGDKWSNGGNLGLAIDEGLFLINVSLGGCTLTGLTSMAGAEFRVMQTRRFILRGDFDSDFAGLLSGAFSSASFYERFWKWGWGALAFRGQGSYSNSGGIWFKGGRMVLDYTGTGNYSVNKYTDSASLIMCNGVLELDGASDGPVAETVGTLSMGATYDTTMEGGLATIRIVPGTQNTTLTFANTAVLYVNANNNEGCILRFLGVDGTASRVMFGGAGVANNGILGGYGICSEGTPDYAAYNHAGGGVSKLSEAGRPTAFSANNNVLLTSGTTSLPGGNACHSLKIKGSQRIDLAGGTWTNNSGGILQTGAAGDTSIISNGTITVGQVKAGGYVTGHLFVYADKDLTLDNCNVNGLDATVGGISKAGPGKLTLTPSVTVSQNKVRWYEGSLDLLLNTNVNLYASGEGYGPNSTLISNTGTLTVVKSGPYTTTVGTILCVGGINLDGGVFTFAADSGSGYVFPSLVMNAGATNAWLSLTNNARFWYIKSLAVSNTDFRGSGFITMNTASNGSGTVRTLTSGSGKWTPGDLTVQGNLVWTNSGSRLSTFKVDITGPGTAPGVDYGRLTVTGGSVSGLQATPANSTVDLYVEMKKSLADSCINNTYIVLTNAGTAFGSLRFHDVVWVTPKSTGTVNYLNGAITLTNVKVQVERGSIFLIR